MSRVNVLKLKWWESLETEAPAQVSSSSLDWGLKLRGPSPIAFVLLYIAMAAVAQWLRLRTHSRLVVSSNPGAIGDPPFRGG
ncbi:hypothetical protein TNCV_509761 [Trichonephila clavipes]|nr:hypothetical protein TNCV_509761 [Trichonephila clavipes]